MLARPNTAIKLQRGKTENSTSSWNGLYKMGAAAALFAVLLIPIQLVVFTSSPPPDTALGWFELFQENKFLGLLGFEILFVFNAVIALLTAVALYVALRETDKSLMVIVLIFSLIGSVTLIMARPAIDMLYLSDQYANATTEAQRGLYLAAGETLLASFNGTGFHVSYNLANISYMLIAIVMLKGTIFSRLTAYMAFLAGIVGFGLYLPTIGIVVSIVSVLFLALYQILVARRLFQLAQSSSS